MLPEEAEGEADHFIQAYIKPLLYNDAEHPKDLAAKGMSSLLVEGGAATATHFLDEDLIDRIVLFRGAVIIGKGGLAAPIDEDHMPAGFRLMREATYGDDRVAEWARPI